MEAGYTLLTTRMDFKWPLHFGSLDHWIIGSLDHWIIGSLDHWIIGSLEGTVQKLSKQEI